MYSMSRQQKSGWRSCNRPTCITSKEPLAHDVVLFNKKEGVLCAQKISLKVASLNKGWSMRRTTKVPVQNWLWRCILLCHKKIICHDAELNNKTNKGDWQKGEEGDLIVCYLLLKAQKYPRSTTWTTKQLRLEFGTFSSVNNCTFISVDWKTKNTGSNA